MNNNDLFFTNKFVKIPETEDLGDAKTRQFRQSHEEKLKKDRQEVSVNSFEKRYLDNTLHGSSSKELVETKICIDTVDRDKNAFPLQNDFKFFLGRTFKNVQKIELISTSVPNTDTSIKDLPVQLQNNIITWINEEDIDLGIFTTVPINQIQPNTVDITVLNHKLTVGSTNDILIFNSKLQSDLQITGFLDGKYQALVFDDSTLRILWKGGIPDTGTVSVNIGYPTYTITLVPGNYSAATIIRQMTYQFNLVKRKNGEGQYHYFNITLNIDTNVINLESVITNLLQTNPISTTSGSTIITITSLGHGFKTGDTILMIGTQTTAGINGAILDGDFIITVIDSNTFTYEVNVPAVSSTQGGGNNVKTGKQAPYKILFDTANTLIQYNIGFQDEDSSEYIGASNPITTKTLEIIDAEITAPSIITLTTSTPHTLIAATIIPITIISTGTTTIEVTTSIPHLIQLPIRVTARFTNSQPPLLGEFIAYPNSPTSFFVENKYIEVAGNSGEIIYGDDIIRLTGILTTPMLSDIPFFYVDNVVSSTKININFSALHINDVGADSQINTNHLYIQDINHGFNNLTSITGVTSQFSLIRTQLNTNFVGSYTDNVVITDGLPTSNTVNIDLLNHGLETSDIIRIKNSTSSPVVDGVFAVQVISSNQLRINVVHGTLSSGVGTVITGDTINLTETNSLPKIDGSYMVINRYTIASIATGTGTVLITLDSPTTGWIAGDTVQISGTNTTPVLSGEFIIDTVLTSTTLKIVITDPIVAAGIGGNIVNNSTFLIESNKTITTPGTKGIIGTSQDVILYRVEADDLKGSTLGGIKLSDINGVKFPITKIIDSNNYLIKTVNIHATSTVTGGGDNVYISSKNKGFKSQISNTVDSTLNTKLARSINLAGDYYVFFTSPGISSKGTIPRIISSSPFVDEIFAQLLLSESPGLMIYNSFVTAPFVFNPLIPNIENMHFRTLTKEGYPFNFNNIDFAFTLQITEVVDFLDNSFVSSRTGNNVHNTVNLLNNVSHTNNSRSIKQEKKSVNLWNLRAGNV